MKTLFSIIKVIIPGLIILFLGCKSSIEIDPAKDQIINEKVYTNDETATSAIRGIYAKMMSGSGFASGGANSITLLAGRSADEFTNVHPNDLYLQFSTNNLLPENTMLRSGLWQEPYQYIYFANLILENLERPNGVSSAVKQQLQGEAKFIRAFCNFYLTNLFGEIPIIITTDYRINAGAFVSSKEEIYAQMIKDLVEAKNQLSVNYPSGERTRANKWVATALLARVYLYHQEWVNAETQASEIIAQTNNYRILDDLNQVFLKNSQEAILQLVIPSVNNSNTYEGGIFILTTAPSSTTHVVLSSNLISNFEIGDQRLIKWVGTFTSGTTSWYYPNKYKIKTGNIPLNEYSMVLRLAEQYLIRAEARIRQGDIQNGIKDLNALRKRARALPSIQVPNPLPDLSFSLGQSDALLAVEKEKRIELFSEWGHRWLDLKRTNRSDAILAPIKGTNWKSTDVLYPIPSTELLNAINLKQNPGYQ